MDLTMLVTIISEVSFLLSALIPVLVVIRKISNGTRCQLRSEMLRIYYHNHASQTIRQYEKENFVMLYEAYKALKGNSFIDDIYTEVRSWEVVT